MKTHMTWVPNGTADEIAVKSTRLELARLWPSETEVWIFRQPHAFSSLPFGADLDLIFSTDTDPATRVGDRTYAPFRAEMLIHHGRLA